MHLYETRLCMAHAYVRVMLMYGSCFCVGQALWGNLPLCGSSPLYGSSPLGGSCLCTTM